MITRLAYWGVRASELYRFRISHHHHRLLKYRKKEIDPLLSLQILFQLNSRVLTVNQPSHSKISLHPLKEKTTPSPLPLPFPPPPKSRSLLPTLKHVPPSPPTQNPPIVPPHRHPLHTTPQSPTPTPAPIVLVPWSRPASPPLSHANMLAFHFENKSSLTR